MFTSLREITGEAYLRLVRDDGLALAGNIAFCMILALFPFLIFLIALAGFFGNATLAQTIVDYLLAVAPKELADPVTPEIRYIFTVPRTDLVTLGALLTLWTASAAVESVRTGLNRAYGFRERRPYWWRLVINIFFVIGGAAVLLVLAGSIVLGPVLWAKITAYLPWMDQFTERFEFLRYPVGLSLMLASLIVGHKYLPVKRHALYELMPGILLTIILWMVAAVSYAQYLAHFNTISSMYSGLAGFIIALGFLYLSAALLIWGGEINQVMIARRRNRKRTA